MDHPLILEWDDDDEGESGGSVRGLMTLAKSLLNDEVVEQTDAGCVVQ